MLVLVILFFIAVISFWISALCGGGASLLLLPLLNTIQSGALAPFSLTIGTFSSSVSRIFVFWKHINWKIFFWFVPFAIPSVFLGAFLLKWINPYYLQFFVALVLLANIPELFKKKVKDKDSIKKLPNAILSLIGFLAGFISGITGAIGLLFNRFYLTYGMSKEEIIATRAANEIVIHLIKLIVYFMLGLFDKNAIVFGLIIAFASVLSTVTIKYILPFLSDLIFMKIGYASMVVSGIFLLISTSRSIIVQDKIVFSKNIYDESTVKWRNSSFVLEFTLDDGLEIERPVTKDELPDSLKIKYDQLIGEYEKIQIEKVYMLNNQSAFEFYCFKNGHLTKLEFD